MKIGQKKSTSSVTSNQLWLAALLFVFAAGVILGEQRFVQTIEEYRSNVVSRLRTNTHGDQLPILTIDMPFDNYTLLLEQRDESLETAVFLANESDFLTADIQMDNQTIPIRLRLRQGTAVHLGEDDKWNFDIRTRNNQQLLNMSRFFLIDPADNNWLNEWAFMQALRREGILAPRYQFVRLIFNGDDRGIYALQEGFGTELVTNQARPDGVIVEFDASRLWESTAYLGDSAAAIADPISNLSADDFLYFEVDSFRDATLARDEMLTAQRETAVNLLRGLQNGEVAASELFDVQQYGRFLALADLWGATAATSLANLRLYYHPDSGKLEPIGFNATPTLDDATNRISLTATYNDAAIQTAYVIAAERFTQPDYVTQLQAELEAEWEAQQQALRPEIDLLPPWEQLAQRQELLHRSLNPLQPVLAYLGPSSLSAEGIIQLDIANVLNLPVEIVGFDINGTTFLEADRTWIQDNPILLNDERVVLPAIEGGESAPAPPMGQAVLHFTRFHLPLTTIIEQNSDIDFNHEIKINVVTRILGQDQTHLTQGH